MTLYIYRVGWTYPARNPITDLNLQKVLVVLGFQVDRSDPPVRPVGVARPATRSRPVRPLAGTDQTDLFDLCQIWSLTISMKMPRWKTLVSAVFRRFEIYVRPPKLLFGFKW